MSLWGADFAGVLSRACGSLIRPDSEKSEADSHEEAVVELPDPIGLKAGTLLTELRCQDRLISTYVADKMKSSKRLNETSGR